MAQNSSQLQEQIAESKKKAILEAALCFFAVKYSHSYNSLNDLVPMLRNVLIRENPMAYLNFSLGSTKASCIVEKVLAPWALAAQVILYY